MNRIIRNNYLMPSCIRSITLHEYGEGESLCGEPPPAVTVSGTGIRPECSDFPVADSGRLLCLNGPGSRVHTGGGRVAGPRKEAGGGYAGCKPMSDC